MMNGNRSGGPPAYRLEVTPLMSLRNLRGVVPVLWRKARIKLAEEQKAQYSAISSTE